MKVPIGFGTLRTNRFPKISVISLTRRIFVIGSIPFILALVSPVGAAEGKRVAFVVGVGAYDNLPSHQQLSNATNDADGVSEKLRENGFDVISSRNSRRTEFNIAWQDVLERLGNDDVLLLFFSGHGIQIDGQNYLLPRDIPYIQFGRQAQLSREAISLNELLNDLRMGDRPHPKYAVIILDACRDNPLIPPGVRGSGSRGGLARMPDTAGTFVIYSASDNRTALDRLTPDDRSKYSVFTRLLLPLLGRSDLSIQQVAINLKDEVWNLAQTVGHAQQPAYYDGIRGKLCIPGCSGEGKEGFSLPARKDPSLPAPTQPTQPTRPTAMEFEVRIGQVYSHPRQQSVAVTFDGLFLSVILPNSPQPRQWVVHSFPEGQWTPLGDQSYGNIPIALMRRGNRLLAQWEP